MFSVLRGFGGILLETVGDLGGRLVAECGMKSYPIVEDLDVFCNRASGTFLRQLNLGQGIDTDAISARYENGVLSVLIPISEKAKPRKIEIQHRSDAPAITV